MNWTIIVTMAILAIALVIFLIIRNQKDEKKFEEQMNDEPKPQSEKDIELTNLK